MHIRSSQEITGEAARALRERSRLPQWDFWRRVGVCQASGCRYENQRRIPEPVRTLLFLRYVAGLDFDVSSEAGAAQAHALAALQASHKVAERADPAKLTEARDAIDRALTVLADIAN